jgi:hypothetical protein
MHPTNPQPLNPAARCLALLASLGRVAIQRLPHGGYTTAITPDARGRHWNLLLLRLDWHPIWRLGGGLVLNLRTRATPNDVANTWPLARQQRLETEVRAAVQANDFKAFARAYRRAASRGMVVPQSKPQLQIAFHQLRQTTR